MLNKLCVVLGPQDVEVRIKALGICGSDVHHFKVRCSSLILQLVYIEKIRTILELNACLIAMLFNRQ